MDPKRAEIIFRTERVWYPECFVHETVDNVRPTRIILVDGKQINYITVRTNAVSTTQHMPTCL